MLIVITIVVAALAVFECVTRPRCSRVAVIDLTAMVRRRHR